MLGPSGFERTRNRDRDAVPLVGLVTELLPPRLGQHVELRPAVVLGRVPLGGEPPGFLEAVECRKEGARLHDECASGELLDAARDTESVELAGRERFENQEIERALKKGGGLAWQEWPPYRMS